MKIVKYIATLHYYDGPQIIEAHDLIGGHYIGVWIHQEDGQKAYLIQGVPPNNLAEFRAGKTGLRETLLRLDNEQWYLTDVNPDIDEPMPLIPQSGRIDDSGLLPKEGFTLYERSTDDSIVEQARARNNTVLQFTTESPQNYGGHRMQLEVFSGLLGNIQNLVKYAYKAELKNLSAEKPYSKFAHMMDVIVPAAPGSFCFVLEAHQRVDLLGDNELNLALKRVDELFEDISSHNVSSDLLDKHRGHLAACYLRLLKLLVNHRISIDYTWATPNLAHSSRKSMSFAKAEYLVDFLSEVANLGQEVVVLEGKFQTFNRKTGKWGLLTDEGVRSGEIWENELTLDGLEVGKNYRFHCIEEVTLPHTGDERHAYFLQRYESA